MSGPPETRGLRRAHFVAVGGTGMGSLAGLLAARGVEVTGSDRALYPPMSTALARWGIPVDEGFAPEHVLARRPDLVVIGNAVRADNPEARAAVEAGLRCLSFPDALYELAIRGRHSVVVAGTHGKTTVTSLIGHLLLAAGRDPSLLVGGIAENLGGSFREGAGEHFVVEGDEYDTAFFDKTPKFLHYGARTLVLTSVELDHADIYRDLDHVKEAFRMLVRGMPRDGTIVAAIDHEGVRDVLDEAPCVVIGYGVGSAAAGREARAKIAAGEERSAAAREVGSAAAGGNDSAAAREAGLLVPGMHPPRRAAVASVLRARRLETGAGGTQLLIEKDGREVARARSPLFGRCNAENTLGALAAVSALGVPLEQAAAALPAFRGVKRRQEVRGEAGGVTVVDDFAHHPTAVRETVQAVRERFPGRRLVAVFEPRSNTSRRRIFQAEYAKSFDAADAVVISEPPGGPVYSATGDPGPPLSASELARDLDSPDRPAAALGGPDAALDRLAETLEPGDVVLIMSNGDFGDLWTRLLTRLRRRCRRGRW